MRGAVFAETFKNSTAVECNNGTVTGTPTIDRGASFDGSADRIDYGQTLTGVQSVSFWVTLATTTEDIIKLSATHSITVSGGTVTATGWTSPTIYVNGVVTSTITTARSFVTVTTGTGFTADDIQVGYVSSFGEFTIEDLLIWSVALTAQEIADYNAGRTYNYRNRAVADWPMLAAQHDTSNDRTLDVSGNQFHAQFGDGSTPGTFPQKRDNRGYQFDGAGDYMTCGDVLASYTGSLTITILVETDSITGFRGYCARANAPTNVNYYLRNDDGKLEFYFRNDVDTNNYQYQTTGDPIHVGLQHVAFCHTWGDENSTRVHIDGEQVNGAWISGGDQYPLQNAFPFNIGMRDVGNHYFSGGILCLKVWFDCLTPLQIADDSIRMINQVNEV
jgi:hypothetical protein